MRSLGKKDYANVKAKAHVGVKAQSRQSAKLFLQSLKLELPQPLTHRQVCTSPAKVAANMLA
jgi:hypothetical protein